MFKSLFVTFLAFVLVVPVWAQPDTQPRAEEIPMPAQKISAQSMQVSPDGKWLAMSSLILHRQGQSTRYLPEETQVQFWEVATGQRKWSARYPGNANTNLIFSPDSSRLLFTRIEASNEIDTMHFSARLYDVAKSKEICTLETEAGEWITNLHFAPDSKHLLGSSIVVNAGKKNRATGYKRWDAISGRHIEPVKGFRSQEGIIAFSSDGKQLITGQLYNESDKGFDYIISSHAWPEMQMQKSVTMSNSIADKLAFSPDGSRVAMVSYTAQNLRQINRVKEFEICLWNMESGKLETLFFPEAVTFNVSKLEFSSDGKTLIGSGVALRDDAPSGMEIWFWNAETGELERTLNRDKKFGRSISSMSLRTQIAADGKSFFMSADAGEVALRSLTDGALIRSFK
jgi:WD40 repeat protein